MSRSRRRKSFTIAKSPLLLQTGLSSPERSVLSRVWTYGFIVGNNPINGIDPLGLYDIYDFGADSANFIAGLGDNLTLGLSAKARGALFDDNGGVDKCSGSYRTGEWTGTGLSLATGVVGGIKAAGVKAAGMEFSHFIPNRMGGARSIWNGNFVSKTTHALSDPYRYRFMPKVWKEANPMPNRLSQLWDRLPNTWKGTAAGAAWGAAGQASDDCECKK